MAKEAARPARYATNMSKGWRVNIAFHDQSRARRRSYRNAVRRGLRDRLGDQVRVASSKIDTVLYADTADAAKEAEHVAREVLAQHNANADFRLEYWDARAEAWRRSAATGRPAAPTNLSDAHEYQQQQERERSKARGLAEWQVRVNLPSHYDVKALAERLTQEGWPVVRRRKYLIAGANCEDDANSLAQEVRGYIGADAVVRVERSVFGWTPLSSLITPGPSA